MAKWRSVLQQDDDVNRDTYEVIILCFGLADDQLGTAVALRAMQQLYGLYPDQVTVRRVAMQLAKVNMKGSGMPRRRLNLNSDTKKKIAVIGTVLSDLKSERLKALEERGVDVDAMDETQKSEETVLLLCDVLRFTVQTKNKKYIEAGWQESGKQITSVERMGETAAEEMGVPECAPF
jgi:hypothetical protein